MSGRLVNNKNIGHRGCFLNRGYKAKKNTELNDYRVVLVDVNKKEITVFIDGVKSNFEAGSQALAEAYDAESAWSLANCSGDPEIKSIELI